MKHWLSFRYFLGSLLSLLTLLVSYSPREARTCIYLHGLRKQLVYEIEMRVAVEMPGVALSSGSPAQQWLHIIIFREQGSLFCHSIMRYFQPACQRLFFIIVKQETAGCYPFLSVSLHAIGSRENKRLQGCYRFFVICFVIQVGLQFLPIAVLLIFSSVGIIKFMDYFSFSSVSDPSYQINVELNIKGVRSFLA